jgi:ribose transport system permease protein
MLPAFAAAFLGAAAFKPGTFNVAGSVLAIFTLATGVTGLQLAGAPYWIDQVFNGTALILAVTLTRYLRGETINPV